MKRTEEEVSERSASGSIGVSLTQFGPTITSVHLNKKLSLEEESKIPNLASSGQLYLHAMGSSKIITRFPRFLFRCLGS